MLTEAHKQAIRRSWQLVEPIGETAADLFYKRLFELAPAYRRLFPDDLAPQKRKLLAMLKFIVRAMDWSDDAWRDTVDVDEATEALDAADAALAGAVGVGRVAGLVAGATVIEIGEDGHAPPITPTLDRRAGDEHVSGRVGHRVGHRVARVGHRVARVLEGRAVDGKPERSRLCSAAQTMRALHFARAASS